MNGEAIAIMGAIVFAVSGIATRRAVMEVADASVGIYITIPLGVIFFGLILIATGLPGNAFDFSWQGYIWLSAAGILHFIGGRILYYQSVQLSGANVTSIMTRVAPLEATFFGIILLSEPFALDLILGVLLIVFGLVVTTVNPRRSVRNRGLFSGMSSKAILAGLGAGLVWGISPILVKIGLNSGSGSPIAGVLVSYAAAALVLGIPLSARNTRTSLKNMKGKAVGLFCIVGLTIATAHLLRYLALSIAPASVVAPLFSISPIFLLFLSFLFNRKLEVFNGAVIVGALAVVIGTVLVV